MSGGGGARGYNPLRIKNKNLLQKVKNIVIINTILNKREVFIKKGFTLAEVLITLGIIGVVAAMTLPSVITNSRNKQLEVGLKKSYSVISQALNQYQAETGERITFENQGIHTLKPILMKYFKTVQDCGFGTDVNKACIPNKYYLPEEDKADARGYRTYDGKAEINMGAFDDGQFVLNDGSLILIQNDPISSTLLLISVDVNGYNKKPNRLGHDLFVFQIDNKGTLLPMGVKGTAYPSNSVHCSISSSNAMNGAGCTYNALTDKDYFKNLPK